MKKKWSIGFLIALFVIASICVACQHETPSTEAETMSVIDNCWDYVADLNIVEQDDGTVKVTLTAPDYVSLVKLLADKNTDTVTSKQITKAVKNNPDTVKEYTFTASSSEEDDVKKALMEQISYELLALTLEDMIGG